MISNSSPPRTAPLTTLNNSPFSRGARAVHQGQKKAKAYNISISEVDETISGQSKDAGNDVTNGQLIRSLGETSPNQTCDSPALTPISKGILKRKREAEMEAEDGNGVSCSKKKVIFADPISATKLIESRKLNVKTTRKRRLRYEEPTESADGVTNDPQPEAQVQAVDKPSEPQVTTNVDAAEGPDSENSDPVVEKPKQAKSDGRVRKMMKNGATTSSLVADKSGKESNSTNEVAKGPINSVPEKIIEHSNASEELVQTNLDETSEEGNSDAVFSELESLLQVIESPCADKKSSKVDPVVIDEETEPQTAADSIKGSLIDSNTKSNTMDQTKDLFEESPVSSPEARLDIEETLELHTSHPSHSVTKQEENLPTKEKEREETEEVKMDVDEEVNQPSTTKPLLESWVNVKKSVDLFIQSYCTMLTSRMKSWLNVKGINTIGDFANLVDSSSDRLTESPICPLNEETIMSTFQFMNEHKLNEESSSLELNEKVNDDGQERGRGMSETETEMVQKAKEIDTIPKNFNETQTKVKRLSTLKVIVQALPLELSSKIISDKPSASDYLDAVKEILPPTPDTELNFSGSTIEDELLEIPEVPIKESTKLSTSRVKDTSRKIFPKKVPDLPQDTPIKKPKVKELTKKKSTTKKPTAKNSDPVKKFDEKSEPTLNEIQEDSPETDSPEKDSESSAPKLSVITSEKIELELECKPNIDAASIVPRASIVIKRLTEDEIIQLSRPKITISMEISEEVALLEDKGDTQSAGLSLENKMIEEESLKIDSPPSSSLAPPTETLKDNEVKSTLSIQDGSSNVEPNLRKSRRKRDSELPVSKLLTPSTRTRRRTVSVKIG